ncbi:MAG: flagellar assembly protein FliW [Opitutaceae bacterium]|nr:flagellar assembly protein FliW [Opitutaceae bacterium]
MKVFPDLVPLASDTVADHRFALPQGLVGFKDYTRGELHYTPDQLPFLWLRLHGLGDPVHFIVIEPGGLVPDYELEIFDEDAASLELRDPGDALVLNIVNLRQQQPVEATVNLIGPIVVNRRTHVGRQLVIANYSRYSAHHLLVDRSAAALSITA